MTEGVRINRRLAVVNSIASQITFVLKLTVLLWINQLLAKRVPAEEFKLLSVVNGLMLLPPVVTEIMTGGLGRFVMEAMGRGDRRRVSEIVSSLVPVLTAVAVTIAGLGALAVWKIDALIDVDERFIGDCRFMLGLLLGTVVVRLPIAPFMTGFYVKQEVFRERSIRIGSDLLRLVIVVALTLVLGARVRWLIVGSVISACVAMAVRYHLSRRLLPELRFDRRDVRSGAWREVMNFGWWYVLRTASRRVRNAITPLVTNNLAGGAEVSALHLGTMIQRQAPQAIGQALGPIGPPMVAMFARGEHDRIKAAFLNGARYALTMTGFLVMPFLALYGPFVRIYLAGSRSEYDLDTVATVMLIATATVILRASSTLVGALATASGEVRGLAWRAVVTQSAALGATILCVGPLRMGAIGAAGGPLVVLLFLLPLIHLRYSVRLAGTTVSEWSARAVRPVMRASIAGLILWFGARFVLAPDSWLELALAWAPGAVVFSLFAWTDALGPKERRDILRALEKLQERFTPGRLRRRAVRVAKRAGVPVLRRLEAVVHARTDAARESLSLPHFLVIGAQKSGTTWLHAALAQHPRVFMPERKELHYFDLELHRSLHLYTRAFEAAPPGAVRGEITPAYAILSPARVAFVRRVLPGARLVYVMRDPIERAWSQAVMELATRRGKAIDEVTEDEVRGFLDSAACRSRSDYAMTIERWERHYPRDRILYSFFGDVGERRLLEDVFAHIGVGTDVDWSAMPVGEVIRPRIDSEIPGDHSAAPPWVRELLRERHRDMIARLEDRFGAPVSRWRQ